MSDQTIQLALILLVLVLALLVLPAALFIRLVETILSAGFREVRQELESLQARTHSLTGTENSTLFVEPTDTPTTQESPPGELTEPTRETK